MVNVSGTVTSNFINVNDGDTVEVKPSLIADTSKEIYLKNFEIRWRGDETFVYDNNKNDVTATANTNEIKDVTEYNWSLNDIGKNSERFYFDGLTPSDGFEEGTKDYYKIQYTITANSGHGSGRIAFSGTNYFKSQEYDIDASTAYYISSGTIKIYEIPDNIYLVCYDEADNTSLDFSATISEVVFSTETTPRSASTTYPQVPNGYSFVKHIKEIDGSEETVNENEVGESVEVTASTGSKSLQLTTVGNNNTTKTTVSISGTVSFSPSISELKNNTTTSWYNLSNINPNSNNILTQNITGSNKAEFQYKFDWEIAFPEPAYGKVAFYNDEQDKWEETAVADKTDDLLEYSHIEVFNESMGEWGCLDVVEATETAAIEEYRFYDAETDKWLAPRKYSST